MSWIKNNSVITKQEKDSVRYLMHKDLISLNEMKTPQPVSLPSTVTFTSSVTGSSERGGTI